MVLLQVFGDYGAHLLLMLVLVTILACTVHIFFRKDITVVFKKLFEKNITVVIKKFFKKSEEPGPIPVSVNYHFTRKCNKECGFCFHTEKTSFILNIDEAKKGLILLKDHGMKKINFAGGEPFLYPDFLGKLCQFCKESLKLESVSIVTNGSKVKENWFERYGKFVDILAVSCDSFNEDTNILIGRGDGNNVNQLRRISGWCKQYDVMFKMNTVVCRYNFDEDMATKVSEIGPFRWKCFQVLIQPGENNGITKTGEKTKRDATKFMINDDEFGLFCSKHNDVPGFVPESNRLMASSYLILDEYMRFLDKAKDLQSESILEIGVGKALKAVEWDEKGFKERGGEYNWSKDGIDGGLADGGSSCKSEIQVPKW